MTPIPRLDVGEDFQLERRSAEPKESHLGRVGLYARVLDQEVVLTLQDGLYLPGACVKT